MKRALVIEHDESGPAAGVGERLVEHGYQLDVFRVLDDQADPVCTKAYPDATSYDVLVVTGSPWSVTDTEPAGKAVVALLSDWFPATTGEIVHVDTGYNIMGL